MTTVTESIVRLPPARGLSTARSVLRVLGLLAESAYGIRAADVARKVGKSMSAAYYLLDSLCEEGFATHETGGWYRPRRHPVREPEPPHPEPDLTRTAEELFLRTRKRSYLGRIQAGAIEIAKIRGHQRMPNIPGLGARITDQAQALAIGKVILARLPDETRRCYAQQQGLRAFTAATITAPAVLITELEEARGQGYAVKREEFRPDLCRVAAPVVDSRGRLAAVLGVWAATHAFDAERSHLAEVVCDVASKHVPKSRQILTAADAAPRVIGRHTQAATRREEWP